MIKKGQNMVLIFMKNYLNDIWLLTGIVIYNKKGGVITLPHQLLNK